VVFSRFKALLVEPSALTYAERHDNIEAIYKKLGERRDTADVSALLKLLHRIVNQAIATQAPGWIRPGSDGGPVADQHGKAARGVWQEGEAQGHGDRGHSPDSWKKSWRRCWPATRCA
jgi:hypothetical protein